jgi:hypothetical protein
MSEIYGQWLGEIDSASLKEKYLHRIAIFDDLAEKCLRDIELIFPELKGKVYICRQNIDIALGRYFNDIHRFKVLHNIKTVNPSKMIAHSVKWLHLNPVLFGSIERDSFAKISKKSQVALLNVNFAFIAQALNYMFSEFNSSISDARMDNVLYNIQYYLKTGLYQERMASLWFEELLARG